MNIQYVTHEAILNTASLKPLLNVLVTGSLSHLSYQDRKRVNQAIESDSIPDFLCCDPDYVRANNPAGKGTSFEIHEIKGTHYVISLDSLTDSECTIIADFLYQKNITSIDNSSWDNFYSLTNGIAYRGGAGYAYALYKHQVN